VRKPRDFDAELKALGDKARQLKDRKLVQLGELVVACGADTLAVEQLAGALLSAVENKDAAIKEGWRKRGGAFFQGAARNTAGGNRGNTRGTQTNNGGAQ
jgi:DNA-binding protein H-NS